jgi:Fic family protein
MDKNGYKMDISNKMAFSPAVFQQIMQQLSIVDSFKGGWNTIELQHSKHLKELKKIATIESIGSSTRIEGATLTNAEVEKLLKNIKITKLKTREQTEVVGYYEALEIILENFATINLTENYLHQLHSILLKHSSKDQRHKGKYKNLSNKVVANYPDGTQRIIFKTTEPHLTAFEMQNLIQWTNERFETKDTHPLITIAVFIYEFLSVHPYQDGNGRLSRLLTTLLMIKQDYKFIQYVSFENIIEAQKSAYYKALMNGQKNRGKTTEKIDQWVLFFMDCMVTLTQRLQAKYDTYSQLDKALNERQQKIIQLLKKLKKAQIKDIAEAFTNHSRNTLKKDIALLVNEGLILKIGTSGRGVTYYPKPKN